MTVQPNNQTAYNNLPMYMTNVQYAPQAQPQTATVQGNTQPVNGTQNMPANNSNGYIYNYPTTSVYRKPESGVTIQIFNPSAIGAPNSTTVTNPDCSQGYSLNGLYNPPPNININDNNNNNNPQTNGENAAKPAASTPIANTPIKESEKKEKEDKQVVELTDTYIKTLENYLKSPDTSIRKNGIIDLIKRYEEDSTRYNDPALTALLNIALKDPTPSNRMLMMSAIAGELATGDETTVNLLDNLQKSDKLYGQEAQLATEALLKAVQTKTKIPVE